MKKLVVISSVWLIGFTLGLAPADARPKPCRYRNSVVPWGAHWCQGSTLMYCAKGKHKVRAQCAYGCYALGSVRAYCRCPGGFTYSWKICLNNKRYQCLRSREAKGGYASLPCGKNLFCKGRGQCVPQRTPICKEKGKTYIEGARWCVGQEIHTCSKGRVRRKETCKKACLERPKRTWCQK